MSGLPSNGDGLGPAGATGLDAAVERVGRRLAARTTRRSLLERAAKVAVLVAGGPTLVSLLADQAEARVCGQSGVAPKCPTFDCVGEGNVWGWCWYASGGCCSNGGLKKICDCCRLDHPFVHGYCPSGHNVLCIVESCANDPRVMTVPVARLVGASAPAVAAALSRDRYPDRRGGTSVVTDEADVFVAGVAKPLAAVLDGPALLSARAGLPAATVEELARLGVAEVVVVGPAISTAVDADLAARGYRVRRVGAAADVGALSVEVGREVLARGGSTRAWCVGASGESGATVSAAAAVAGHRRGPLVVGVEAAAQLANTGAGTVVTYLVGPGVAERAGEVAGGFPVPGANRLELTAALARVAVTAERLRGLTLHLVPEATPGLAAAAGPGLVLFHPEGRLGGALDVVLSRSVGIARAVIVGTAGALGSDGTNQLQSALNGFETQFLQGRPGQGLPVIPQPLSERPLGQARVAGALPDAEPGYWSNRANPLGR